MSKLLLDMCVDRRVGAQLHSHGHDAVHAGELGMARSPDTEVMAAALEQGRIVVTHDSDFAQLLARSGADAPSVIQIRAPLAGFEEVAQLVHGVLQAGAEDLEAGAIASVSPRGARLRPLPVARGRKDQDA